MDIGFRVYGLGLPPLTGSRVHIGISPVLSPIIVPYRIPYIILQTMAPIGMCNADCPMPCRH